MMISTMVLAFDGATKVNRDGGIEIELKDVRNEISVQHVSINDTMQDNLSPGPFVVHKRPWDEVGCKSLNT